MPKVKRVFIVLGEEIEIEVEAENLSEMVELNDILPKDPEPPE